MMPRTILVILLGMFAMSGCASRERRIEKIRSQYPQWNQGLVEKVASGEVEIGMTKEMVAAALGQPDRISYEGNEEIWGFAAYLPSNYGERAVVKKLVYFVFFGNGKVLRTAGNRNDLAHIYWYQ